MLWAAPLVLFAAALETPAPAPPAVHLARSAVLRLAAAPAAVFPLLGPLGEKKWAGSHWSPEFVYPPGGGDVEGCVFRTGRQRETTWILTTFDAIGLRVRYVQLTPARSVVGLDIALSPDGPAKSSARITYAWTGLSEEGNREIERHVRNFGASMAQWEAVLNAFLGSARK